MWLYHQDHRLTPGQVQHKYCRGRDTKFFSLYMYCKDKFYLYSWQSIVQNSSYIIFRNWWKLCHHLVIEMWIGLFFCKQFRLVTDYALFNIQVFYSSWIGGNFCHHLVTLASKGICASTEQGSKEENWKHSNVEVHFRITHVSSTEQQFAVITQSQCWEGAVVITCIDKAST